MNPSLNPEIDVCFKLILVLALAPGLALGLDVALTRTHSGQLMLSSGEGLSAIFNRVAQGPVTLKNFNTYTDKTKNAQYYDALI